MNVLVTGAASGIGRATAELFAREGARVWVTDRDGDGAQRVADALGAEAATLDVTREDDWIRVMTPLQAKLDVLIANAGIAHGAPLTEMSLDDWRRVMAVNLDGVFLGLKHGIPAIRAHGRGGSVVIVSSASGLKAAPGAAAYCASKAALRLLSKCAALEHQADKIRVNTVHPAGVVTPMWREMPFFQDLVKEQGEEAAWKAVGGDKFSQPEEVARAIFFLAANQTPSITGTELVIDGGYTA